jgi:hypothetical protein
MPASTAAPSSPSCSRLPAASPSTSTGQWLAVASEPSTPAASTPLPASPAPAIAGNPRPDDLFFRHVYTRRTPAAAPAGPPPLPKGAVPVHLVVNQHTMTTKAKQGFRQPAYLGRPLSVGCSSASLPGRAPPLGDSRWYWIRQGTPDW